MATANLLDVRVDIDEMGRRIDEARERAGLSVTQLSFRAEINESLLRKYLKGMTEPGSANLARIAKALAVNADWLLQNTDNPAPVQDVWVKGESEERRASSRRANAGPPKQSATPPQRNRNPRRRSA